MKLEDFIVRLWTQEQYINPNLTETKIDRKAAGNNAPWGRKGQRRNSQNQHLKPERDIDKNKRKDVNCFACGKKCHFVKECHHRKANNSKGQANIIEEKKENFVAIVTEVNMVSNHRDWWVDTGAIKHVCSDISAFTSYTQVGNESEIYIGNSYMA